MAADVQTSSIPSADLVPVLLRARVLSPIPSCSKTISQVSCVHSPEQCMGMACTVFRTQGCLERPAEAHGLVRSQALPLPSPPLLGLSLPTLASTEEVLPHMCISMAFLPQQHPVRLAGPCGGTTSPGGGTLHEAPAFRRPPCEALAVGRRPVCT